ncbi:hypothetical protein [Oleiagrimonas sp. C23AA]|nr:hypothetical protein [Oleiagrimonas sp. C23AA]NII11553.1 hypothetical protein [Oleiagrimonas sp. C23AA]
MNNMFSFAAVFLLVGAGWYLLETMRSRAKASRKERAQESNSGSKN